jgi:TPR repeat protein
MAYGETGQTGGALAAPTKPSFENFFELGVMYSTGREVATDLVAAHKWFNLAAVEGNLEAATYRQEVAREMSPMEIAKAQRAAREWLQTH